MSGDGCGTVIRHFVNATQNWEGFGMNTSAVAERLNTTPKTLRRFLRSDPTYMNAGSGGKYDFAESDMPTLTRRFTTWSSKSRPAAPKRTTPVETAGRREVPDNDVAAPVRAITTNNPVIRANIRKLAAEREQNLRQLMIDAGLHISQTGVAKKNNPRSYAKVDA